MLHKTITKQYFYLLHNGRSGGILPLWNEYLWGKELLHCTLEQLVCGIHNEYLI
jgi:hypothetical protein